MKKALKAACKRILIVIYRLMTVLLPVRKTGIILMSDMGRNYSGNPRAIWERGFLAKPELIKGIKAVWVFNREFLRKHPGFCVKSAKVVCYGSLSYYYQLATAKSRIFDTRQEPYVIKRKTQLYLQTWHGTPLKKLGLDIEHNNMAGEKGKNLKEEYASRVLRESAKWDILLAPNTYSECIFKRCFGYNGKVLNIGYPRNDELVSAAGRSAGKTADQRKVILYAPTWRDDEYGKDGWYSYSRALDLELMEKELKDEYRIIVKLHYLVKLSEGDIPKRLLDSGFVEVLESDSDINSAYLSSDMMITDYSSVMFDYSILGRPMFFFAYDIEKYREELRGFYFDFEKEAPGPVVKTTAKLIEAIKEGDNEIYRDRYKSFREKYNASENGTAALRVAEYLRDIM